jgi:carboxymethylenebutenolidase
MAETFQLLKQWINIPVLDGKMEAYLVKPAGKGPWPAVLVLMEIYGVNRHIRDVAERFAREGYVAIAPNYYHRTTPNLELDYNDLGMAEGRKHKAATTRENILVDLRATIDVLQQDPDVSPKDRMACVGFCFGGHVAYIAASFKEIAATAAFYPGGVASTSPGGGPATVTHTPEIQGEILCLFGEKDPLIPHEETVAVERALQMAHVPHEVVRYSYTGHGFFCDQRQDYDAAAAEDAWHRVLALFKRTLR